LIVDYDPLITVNEKIGIVSDLYQLKINQTNQWINSVINQPEKDSKIKKDYCEICLIRYVKFFSHHVGGRYNDFRQITVCGDCHYIVTEKQKIDARIWTEGNPDFLKRSFFLRGLYDILILMAQKRNNPLYSDIANLLTNTIYSLQRSVQN
jgi:hypothetical protein